MSYHYVALLEYFNVGIVVAGEVRIAPVRADHVLLHCTLDVPPEMTLFFLRHRLPAKKDVISKLK